jgi:alpha-1,2-mannosyltransferase
VIAVGPTGAAPGVGDLPRPLWQQQPWYRWKALLIAAWVTGATITAGWTAWVFVKAPHGFVDLAVYRFGIRAWWYGGDLYGRLPATVAGHLPFVYPPVTALLLGPLAVPSWSRAVALMLVLSVAAIGVVEYVTVRRVWPAGGRRGAALATAVALPLALALEPVWDTLWYGQVNIVLMALVVLDCLTPAPRWPRGVLIGIAAAIKLTPAVFLLYFLLRKDFRSAARLALTAAALTVLGFVVNWSGSLKYWFGSSGGARSVSGSAFFTNQTIDGALARLSLPHVEQTLLWLVLSALVLAFGAIGIRRAQRLGDAPLAMVVTAACGLIVSPTSWSNHWVYVVPALIVLAGYAVRGRHPGWILAVLLVALTFWSAPFLNLPNVHGAELHWTLLQQFPGNAFTVLGVVLLVAFAAPDVPTTVSSLRAKLANRPALPRVPKR